MVIFTDAEIQEALVAVEGTNEIALAVMASIAHEAVFEYDALVALVTDEVIKFNAHEAVEEYDADVAFVTDEVRKFKAQDAVLAYEALIDCVAYNDWLE